MSRPFDVVTSDGKRLTLTPNNLNPQVVITFKDGTRLQISGQNLTQSADMTRVHARPHLLRNRKPVQDPRLVEQWPSQVRSVTVSQAAGPRGIYLALVAIGWGPAVRNRIDVLGSLEEEHVQQIKSGQDLLDWITGIVRKDARPHFRVLSAV